MYIMEVELPQDYASQLERLSMPSDYMADLMYIQPQLRIVEDQWCGAVAKYIRELESIITPLQIQYARDRINKG